uniref:Rieske 2Fe-2S family protein n=2 Tax=Candidatus Bipolaricaulota TaxID=67810 RepID=H5SHY5_9BACT|nr:Rieske 2Fe-2S family protein [uncultured Acetothermia bacterium]BAL57084.1 Rieske 2Fe-2S family protein [uncultured Acetothermia bacterium]BAL58793.1 biphenyl dioxygenase [Candidatus Acetothermum autotrophicum]
MSKKIKVATVGELAPGQYKSLEIGDERIALFNIAGKFYALKDVCTHDGGILTGGTLRGYIIECPRHGAQFDVRTGAVVRLPAYVGVETYPVSVEGNDIYISVE